MEPLRIHIADEVLNDLRARLHQTRWPEQIPGIGWEQGTELDWSGSRRLIISTWVCPPYGLRKASVGAIH